MSDPLAGNTMQTVILGYLEFIEQSIYLTGHKQCIVKAQHTAHNIITEPGEERYSLLGAILVTKNVFHTYLGILKFSCVGGIRRDYFSLFLRRQTGLGFANIQTSHLAVPCASIG